MVNSRIENLIVKYLSNQASVLELDELESWILESSKNEILFNSFVKTNYAIDYNLKKFDIEKVKKALQDTIEKESKVIKFRRIKKIISYSAAAVIIGLAITLKDVIFNFINEAPEPKIVNTNKIIPGSDKAILTLDDGSVIELNKEKAFQTKQVKIKNGQIIYESTPKKLVQISYNYLTIPRGGQFYLELADGTSVWLNSESKLKYPVAFIEGKPRKVELIYGEAYFNVSSSSNHEGSRFVVLNQFQEIEVLGTEFNIQAYKDEENVYTTLVEGKVALKIGDSTQNLIPSQQSNLNTKNNNVSIEKVDVKSVVSWKDGYFSFKGKPLKDIAKVLSRWYDVDIIFEKKSLESLKFKGSLNKSQSINEILSIMKSNTINNYEIKDDKTIILK